ncbi:Vegetative incompatibility protein HET-E-1 [Colletotrichum shisoi]|uniref:Vegetative incompatibility protein HET-E-1 n=1 Tax=Colletotrichum shisoi TaxID=2078593 RepID=A0A5Q4BF99_9PEZI|nr:Vegetative incompatibility protein HET-E-1 [Colletotrichum shisoi]
MTPPDRDERDEKHPDRPEQILSQSFSQLTLIDGSPDVGLRQANLRHLVTEISPWELIYLRSLTQHRTPRLADLPNLPEEVVAEISALLDGPDILTCTRVSKAWRRAWTADLVTKDVTRAHFSGLIELSPEEASPWLLLRPVLARVVSVARGECISSLFIQTTGASLLECTTVLELDARACEYAKHDTTGPSDPSPIGAGHGPGHQASNDFAYCDGKVAWKWDNYGFLVDDIRASTRTLVSPSDLVVKGEKHFTVCALSTQLLVLVNSLTRRSLIVCHLAKGEHRRVTLPSRMHEVTLDKETFVVTFGPTLSRADPHVWRWESGLAKLKVPRFTEIPEIRKLIDKFSCKLKPYEAACMVYFIHHPTNKDLLYFVTGFDVPFAASSIDFDSVNTVRECLHGTSVIVIHKFDAMKYVQTFSYETPIMESSISHDSRLRCRPMNSYGLYNLGFTFGGNCARTFDDESPGTTSRAWNTPIPTTIHLTNFNAANETFTYQTRAIRNMPRWNHDVYTWRTVLSTSHFWNGLIYYMQDDTAAKCGFDAFKLRGAGALCIATEYSTLIVGEESPWFKEDRATRLVGVDDDFLVTVYRKGERRHRSTRDDLGSTPDAANSLRNAVSPAAAPTMRLINVNTLSLDEFYGDDVPRYAIVSHTWGAEEVTFQDWGDHRVAREKNGFQKIELARAQALRDGLDYLWIDTCCINKESSAELSEAINSMFAWYECSMKCYAYLCDIEHAGEELGSSSNESDKYQVLSRSRWFTRGWTLQELLAPREVLFFSREWSPLGNRRSLADAIQSITNIDCQYLHRRSRNLLSGASIAERMSWLSCRKTTRVEDMAYCMLGIFDINMLLLYGEGAKSFTRLQEEILKNSTDQSLFCWSWTENDPGSWVSMLAPSPRNFRNGQGYQPANDATSRPVPYSMTNFGLSIQLTLIRPADIRISNFGFRPPQYIGVLAASTKDGHLIGVPLEEAGVTDTYRVIRDFPRPIALQWTSLRTLKAENLQGEVHDIFVPSKASGRDLEVVQVKPYDSSFHLGEYAVMLLIINSRGSGVEIFTRTEAIPRYTDSMAGFITMKKFRLPRNLANNSSASSTFRAIEAHGALVRLHSNSLSQKDGALCLLFGVLVDEERQTRWVFRYLEGLAESKTSFNEANLERLLRDASTNWQSPSSKAEAKSGSAQTSERRRVTKRDSITTSLGPEFRAEVNDRKTVARAAHVIVSGLPAGLRTVESL